MVMNCYGCKWYIPENNKEGMCMGSTIFYGLGSYPYPTVIKDPKKKKDCPRHQPRYKEYDEEGLEGTESI